MQSQNQRREPLNDTLCVLLLRLQAIGANLSHTNQTGKLIEDLASEGLSHLAKRRRRPQ